MRAHKKSLIALAVAAILTTVLWNVKGFEKDSSVPLNAYKSLVPGVATLDEVRAAMGDGRIETENPDDLRYAVAGRPELNDRFYFRGDKLALVTSASPDARFANRNAILEQLGTPEAHTLFQTQEYLDFTEKGLRFVCNADGTTTGILYFAPHPRRVPAGYPNEHISLRRDLPRAPAANPPNDFRVGTAKVSIAPQTFEKLVSPKEKLKPHLAEDLFARAVVFERGQTRIVFVGLDVFGMGSWDLDALRGDLARNGFPQVVIAMSHTHANVDTIGFYGYYPKEYSQYVMRQTGAAIVAAAENLRPIQALKMGTTEMPLAGGRVVDLVRNGRDPGVVDPTVAIIQAVGTDGKPLVNLVHLACHPEVIALSRTMGLSPDYVGALCTEVSRELGGETVFLNGALGGMITPDARRRTQEAAEQMGRSLAHFVIEAARKAQPSSSYDLWMHRRPVQYPVTGESVRKFLENPPAPIEMRQGRVSTEMNVVWIGDAQFITVPGELLPDVSFEILARMTGRLRLIVGLANNQLGYLIPSFDFREGGYEERTGPGAAGGEITRAVGLELAPLTPPGR